MTKYRSIYCLLLLVPILWGCPYDSPYGIDDTALENIDEQLIGKWATFIPKPGDDKQYKEEPVKIIFEKATDVEYNIAITGYLDELRPYKMVANDSIKGTAFLSSVKGRSFINALIYGKVYIAELTRTKHMISILPLSDHFTAKYIKNSKELRTAIEYHYTASTMPGYDEKFMLKNLQKVK